jgi:hypothetical protein
MLSQIKTLLQTPALREKLQAATDRAEAVRLITAAAIEKGYAVTKESVSQSMTGLTNEKRDLREEELFAVAGGLGITYVQGCWGKSTWAVACSAN